MTDSVQHERELREAWQVACEEKVEAAYAELNRRLGEMNEFRNQITNERGEYLRKEIYEREHNTLSDRVKDLELSRSEQLGKAAAYASIAGFIGIVAALIGHFWK
jgi:uncharacterized protein YydD (DUF2326 family)